jgi:hypothetical protein
MTALTALIICTSVTKLICHKQVNVNIDRADDQTICMCRSSLFPAKIFKNRLKLALKVINLLHINK